MTRKYDESLAAIQEMQQAGTAVYRVEDMEFGRRLAVERELELPPPEGGKIPGTWINAVWDESGAFVIYPTLLGIKGGFTPVHMATFEIYAELLYLSDHASGEHSNKSGREATWEGRDSAILELEFIPGPAG